MEDRAPHPWRLGRLRMQVVQKQDQRSGILTEGTVHEILTNSATHPHGIGVGMVNHRMEHCGAKPRRGSWAPFAREEK